MEPRKRLRLLNLEMEMQRAWLAAYLEDAESRAARRNRNVLWRLFMSIVNARSLWIAVFDGEQHSARPFSPQRHALHEPQRHQQERTCDAEGIVGRQHLDQLGLIKVRA